MTEWLSGLGILNFWGFVLATIGIVLLPGPNSMYVLTVAAKQGIRRGYAAACGVFVGDAMLIIAAVLGAAVLMQRAPAAFFVLKAAGAVYLSYLGFTMLRGAWHIWRNRTAISALASHSSIIDEPSTTSNNINSTESPFRKALLISLLNPKAILFFLSFLLQSVATNAAHPYWAFFILACVLQLFSFIYLSALIVSGVKLADSFRSRPVWMVLGTASVGCLFIGFALKLALSSM